MADKRRVLLGKLCFFCNQMTCNPLSLDLCGYCCPFCYEILCYGYHRYSLDLYRQPLRNNVSNIVVSLYLWTPNSKELPFGYAQSAVDGR